MQPACKNRGQTVTIKATTSFQKCAAGCKKGSQHGADCLGRGAVNFRRYYHSTGLFAKTCYFVLFRLVLCCSLLICPVGCYALLVVGAAGGMCYQVGGLVAEVLGNTYIV